MAFESEATFCLLIARPQLLTLEKGYHCDPPYREVERGAWAKRLVQVQVAQPALIRLLNTGHGLARKDLTLLRLAFGLRDVSGLAYWCVNIRLVPDIKYILRQVFLPSPCQESCMLQDKVKSCIRQSGIVQWPRNLRRNIFYNRAFILVRQFSLRWLFEGSGMQCKWMESVWVTRFTPSQGPCSVPWVPARLCLQALCYFSTTPVSLLTPHWEVCGKSSRPDHLLTQSSVGMAAQAQNQ